MPDTVPPSATEPFMNPRQAAYFRAKLQHLRANTERELAVTVSGYHAEPDRDGDQTDQASAAETREFDVINRARAEARLNQIDQALTRLDNGAYGYCEDTGEPIDLHRLEAQPTATLTTEAQSAREKNAA